MQLEHRGRLGRPRELGVPDLVAPSAEAWRRLLDADQEVGPSPPAVTGESGLVDDVGSGAVELAELDEEVLREEDDPVDDEPDGVPSVLAGAAPSPFSALVLAALLSVR